MTAQVRIVSCGDDALRLETAVIADRHALAASLKQDANWLEVVIGRESVTVQFDPVRLLPAAAEQHLSQQIVTSQAKPFALDRNEVTLTLLTDPASAPDLHASATRNGLDTDSFLEVILASELSVDMLGFAPGFAYVAGVDPTLEGSRLENPRTHVPAGSVGFISGFLGIYALEGPGGWPIIGRIAESLFDLSSEQPFVLTAGSSIRLVRG